MKVVLDQKVLSQSLNRLYSVVPRKSGKGYDAMLLDAVDGTEHLDVYLGNGEVFAQERIPCSTLEPGTCVANVEQVVNLVKNLSSGEPTQMTLDNNVLIIRQNRLRYSMRMYAFDSFWSLPNYAEEMEFTPLNSQELLSCVSSVSYAILKDSPVDPKSHILVEPLADGHIRAVAVDNIRFASKQGVGVLSEPILLSEANVSSLKKFLAGADGMGVAITKGVVHFHTDKGFLKVRLLATPYPPFKHIFPQKSFEKITFSQADLLPVLKRMRVFSDDKSLIELDVNGGEGVLRVFMMGVGHEDIVIANFSTKTLHLKLSPPMFLEMIENFSDGVLEMRYFGEKSPIMITDNRGEMSLLMPKERG